MNKKSIEGASVERDTKKTAFVFRLWERALNPEKNTEKEKQLLSTWLEKSINEIDFEHRSQSKERVRSLFIPQANASKSFTLYFVAATIVLLATIGTLIFYNSPTFNTEQKSSWITYTTSDKELKTITLSDGSKIFLNNATTFAYRSSGFNSTQREVWLKEGEAFFDVAHNPDKPFIVNYDGMQTLVLGTSFNIKAYSGIDEKTVTVVSGRVLVKKGNKKLGILTVNKRLAYSYRTNTIKISETQAKQSIRWIQGDLNFVDAPYSEIALRLKLKFEVETILQDVPEEEIRITAKFDDKDPLEKVVKGIAWANGINYRIDGKKVRFYQ